MSLTGGERFAASEVENLRVQVDKLQEECERAHEILANLSRVGQHVLFWDGTVAKLKELALQIRQALAYKAVAFSTFEAGVLARRAIDPPDAQLIESVSSQDRERAIAANEPFLASGGEATVLLVPLVAHEQRVGLIEIVLADTPASNEIDLWRALCPQITSIIFAGRKTAEAREACQHEQVLHDITQHLSSGLDLGQTLAQVLSLTILAVGADDGSIMLLDDQHRVVNHILQRKQLSFNQKQRAIQGVMDRGLAGWIIKNGQPAVIADTLTDPRWVQLPGDVSDTRSVLGMPLQHGDRVSGLLFLVHHQPDYFADRHISFLSSVTDQAAVSIENAYLAEQSRQRIMELALINEISQAVSSLHLNDVLRFVTKRIVETLDVRRCAVFLLDESRKYLVLRAVHNPDITNDHMNLPISLADRPHVAQAIETRSPVEIQDVLADDRLRHLWDMARELDIKSQLAVPLITKNRVIGAISIDRGKSNSAFSDSDLSLCQTIAHQAAGAIENARLYEQAQNRAERLWLANMVSRDIGTQLDIHRLLWEVVRLIRETFDCYFVAVGLIEDDELVFRSGINHLYQAIPRTRFHLHQDEQSIAGWVAQNGSPLLISDVRSDPRYRLRPSLGDTRSQISVPLKVLEREYSGFVAADQVIGVLDVGSTTVGAFTIEDQHLLEALATQVAVAIENARLFGRVQEERATLEAIINGTNDAIIITDAADRILFFNPAAQQAFRRGETPHPGALLSDAVDNKVLARFWQQTAQDQARSTEIPLPDGRTLHASITFVAEVGKVAVMQDITYLKELDDIKSEFVSTVSHDLRSPLQVIQTSTELVPRLGQVNQEQRREIEHILAVVRRISDLVQNLLDIGRIEAGVGMDIEACAIDEIIASAAGSCRTLAKTKGIDLAINLPRTLPLVRGNPLRLDQVVSNLVSNAIKFTPEGSVLVTAWAEDERVVIEVRDTGIGIPLDAQEKLFQKFYRVNRPETRGIQGTGLGLAIVKSIVESYGGQVDVESFPRLGSTFTVSLPVHREPLLAAEAA